MKPVLITTEFRGVFFGYLNGETPDLPDKVELKDARNCVYWSSDCKGFLGLAARGPTPSCRVGPKVEAITLFKVTSITPVTEEAAKRWEDMPWS